MPIHAGRVRKFGDNVDTDSITPASSLLLPMDEMKIYAFSPLVKEFHRTVLPHDVIVAGSNFGCGSSRERATAIVKHLGIDFIVCESMARIYLRNCTALGVYPIVAPGVASLFAEGDSIEIDTEAGEVRNPKTGQVVRFDPLTGIPKETLEGGGILPVLKRKAQEAKSRILRDESGR